MIDYVSYIRISSQRSRTREPPVDDLRGKIDVVYFDIILLSYYYWK